MTDETFAPRDEERKGPDEMYAGMIREIKATHFMPTDGQRSLISWVEEKLAKKADRLANVTNRISQARGAYRESLLHLKADAEADVLIRSEAKKIEAIYAYACRG